MRAGFFYFQNGNYQTLYYSNRYWSERKEDSMAKKRIGVLTGGGDVPGLNSAIKQIVSAGNDEGFKIIGIRRGWEGLTHLNLNDPISKERYVMPLTVENTRTIDQDGRDNSSYQPHKSDKDKSHAGASERPRFPQ